MLTCQDVVVVKNAKGEVTATKNYERLWLSYAEGDPVSPQDVTSNKVKVASKFKPDGERKTESQEMFRTALEYLQIQYPKSDSIIITLEQLEYALDLKVRAGIRSQLVPAKPVDADKAVQKMAKTLMSVNRNLSLDEALELVRGIAS